MDRALGWLAAAGRRGWQIGGVAVALWVAWIVFTKLMLLIVTIFVGILIASLLRPVSIRLERLGLPSSAAAALTVIGGVLLIAGIITFLVLQFIAQIPQLTQEFEQVRATATQWLTEGPLNLTQQQIDQYLQSAAQELRSSWQMIVRRVFGVLALIGGLITALVLAYFLVRDGEAIADWSLDRLVSDEQRPTAAAATRRALETLQGYIQATVIIGLLDAVLIGAGLFVLNVPLAGPLAVLTFFGGFFPVVGATVAGLLATLVALISNGLTTALIVLALVIVVQQVDGNILQPVIMGNAVHLHPVVILVVLTAGALLAGIVGAFLAVPVTATLVAIGNEIRVRRDEEALMAERAETVSAGV